MKEKLLRLWGCIKAKKKVLICIAGAVLALIILLTVATAVKGANIKKKIAEKYDGQYYKEIFGESYGYFYAFKDGKLAVESNDSYGGTEGDITVFSDYKIKTSLLENTAWVVQNGRKWVRFQLEDGEIGFSKYEEISPTTLEQMELLRSTLLCGGHEWEETVTSTATCTQEGEKKKVCKKCDATETYTYTASHEYKNDRCVSCGKEKPREKTTLTGNTWYTYTKIPALKVQNMSVTNATVFGQGRGVYVTGYYFCAQCRTFDKSLSMRAPEYGYDVTTIYACDVCGHRTTVIMHLD